MSTHEKRQRILLATGSDKMFEYFSDLLALPEYFPVVRAHSAGEARQKLMELEIDILLVDAPLPDEFGDDLALDQAESCVAVLLLVKLDAYEQTSFRLESSGVLTLSKPNSRQNYYSSVRLLSALSYRLQKMENKNKSLQRKMEDIRAVNRAKWILIDKLNMSESDAHYFIEKRAMDGRIPRREVAESIIRTYDR
ncbi:MAG: ANTAR domain-containing protein [Oscillospiraceae bacterium]|nr:ANTAR domain-containing protein [Oscillospiraceae bacterium]